MLQMLLQSWATTTQGLYVRVVLYVGFLVTLGISVATSNKSTPTRMSCWMSRQRVLTQILKRKKPWITILFPGKKGECFLNQKIPVTNVIIKYSYKHTYSDFLDVISIEIREKTESTKKERKHHEKDKKKKKKKKKSKKHEKRHDTSSDSSEDDDEGHSSRHKKRRKNRSRSRSSKESRSSSHHRRHKSRDDRIDERMTSPYSSHHHHKKHHKKHHRKHQRHRSRSTSRDHGHHHSWLLLLPGWILFTTFT